MVAFAHDLKRLHPSPDERLGDELLRKAIFCAIEHGAVDKFPRVIDLAAIIRSGMLSRSVLNNTVLKSAGTHDNAALLCVLRKVRRVRCSAERRIRCAS